MLKDRHHRHLHLFNVRSHDGNDDDDGVSQTSPFELYAVMLYLNKKDSASS